VFCSWQNATLGSTVIQVQAVDDDIGTNGAVRYRLKHDLVGNWRTFSIDEVTGIIQLKSQLDRQKQKVYEVILAVLQLVAC
jgi:hypothetical protein